jgi:lycopene beta-cyclase
MDARVPQVDGYRFFYVLPLASRRVLVEDTYFSDSPHLDREGLRQEILAYAKRQGASVRSVVREEEGVLPLPLGVDGAPRDWPAPAVGASAPAALLLAAGYQGGWFHPTTGYSFPVALRLAEAVATHVGTAALGARFNERARAQRQQYRFAVFLNQLLYFGFPVPERVNVFERFYGLPADTISRFYALSMTATDQARILVGWPPRGMSLRHAWSRLSRLSRRPEQHSPADSIL